MTSFDFRWDPIVRVNLSKAPVDQWEEAYHWLNDELGQHQVVLTINSDLDIIAWVVEVNDSRTGE